MPTQLNGTVKDIGAMQVVRLLPHGIKRTVGPFIFFDYMPPVTFAAGQGVDVRPHPHIGLSTLTYLFAGSLTHRDSLGYVQDITPGAVNWMQAGRGIVHSERHSQVARQQSHILHAIQAWIAMPEDKVEYPASFTHLPTDQLPLIHQPGLWLRLLAGQAYGLTAPTPNLLDIFYADVRLDKGQYFQLPGDGREAAICVVEGQLNIASRIYKPGDFILFDPAETALPVYAPTSVRFMILGGQPLPNPPHLWWNFVGTKARIETAKEDWQAGRFASVPGEVAFIPLPG